MEVVRVQAIASSAMPKDTIPSEFIRCESEQPAITTVQGASLEVPVISFNEADEEKLVKQVAEASREWGLFQIVNHEIPSEAIKKLQDVGKGFFELPLEEKEKYAKAADSISAEEGYGTKLQKEVEGKKGWVDHLFHKIWPPAARNYRFWPLNPPTYRKANEEYTMHLHGVVNKLLRALSLGLGLEENEVKEALGGEELIYLLKINYYPPCPRPDLALGVVAHTDMSGITILVPNDVQGLQVFRDGHWYDVEYIPNALIIHIGDQLEVVSNGKYKAVLHRSTVNKEKTRISWPVFVEPPEDKEVGPHPKLVTNENPAKYNTKTYREYKHRKLNKLPQ
uniref:Fe2OG dioxygenase domain-containing protein n=1 Tax=Kalanchoe fedtschenkoi TaxID=63787 RepID=A0A7N0VCZ3_KALFE